MADANSIIDTASNLGDIIAKANQNAAQGRVQAGMLNQSQALAAANIYRTQLGAAMAGPTESARSTALGDTMANVKPFEWGQPNMVGNIPVPTGSGGLTPANFGPNTRQAGADLSNLSASRVNSPTFNLPTPPVLPPIPQQGSLSSALGTAGLLANALKALNNGGSGGGGNIGDLIKKLFPGGGGGGFSGPRQETDPNYFSGPRQETDPNYFSGPVDSGPTANVDTTTTINGVPGGFPNNPEDPLSMDPEWWRQYMSNNGGDAGDPNAVGMSPSAEWGG